MCSERGRAALLGSECLIILTTVDVYTKPSVFAKAHALVHVLTTPELRSCVGVAQLTMHALCLYDCVDACLASGVRIG